MRPRRRLLAAAACAGGLCLASPAPSLAARCADAPGGGLTLANVAAAGGVVRAVGSNGLIASARSLRRWQVEPTPIAHNLRGIAWTGLRWVAVGDIGSILHLEPGGWTAVPGLPNTGLRGIAARPGLVAAAGSNGVVLTSPDGVHWTAANSGTTGLLWGATAVGGQLVLSGQSSTVLASGDGITWASLPTAPFPTGNPIAPRPLLWQLAARGRQLVAVGDFGAILEGTLNGGLRGVPSPTPEILRGVAVARGRWVAVGSGGTVLYSDGGRRWLTGHPATSVDLRGVTWTGSRFVAVGDEGTVISSADGAHWRLDQTAMPCALLGVTHGEGRYVAVGGAGRVQLSSDGRHWSSVRRPTRQDLLSVTHGPHGFVAVGGHAAVLTSPDGARWRVRAAPARLNLHAVSWVGSEYLAGGDRGELLGSSDGVRWTRVRFPGFHSIRGFATNEATTVVAGAGTIARRTSPRGPWQLERAGLGRFQTGVAYGGGRFVIVGHNGELLVSVDRGASWSPGVGPVERNLDAVLWTGRRFLATGEGATITSVDGMHWSALAVAARRSLRGLALGPSGVAAVGDLGRRLLLAP